MVREAEAHKAEDDKRREDIETKNKAEAYIHQIDDTLNNESANIPQDQKDEVKKLRDELQAAIDSNDMASLKTKLDALEQAAQAMAQQMYQNPGANPNPGAGFSGGNAGAGNANDDVVDADFTEKN
jgi:molecular chaperone DnaK